MGADSTRLNTGRSLNRASDAILKMFMPQSSEVGAVSLSRGYVDSECGSSVL
jgi:hypothetical protein